MIKDFSLSSFVGGALVGVLLAGVWFFGNNATLMLMPPQQELSSTSSNTATSSDAVSVSDQQSGSAVTVDSLTVPPPGVWIAVRELERNDLGNVLGAVRVSGPQSNISVPLLRATEPGRTYAVELYRDDNNGAFAPGLNSVYVDFTTGSRVVVYFKTTD